ncbi:MAG: ABC transporter ATP-binding protein [Desulfobulbaceae bacterium]
MADLAVQFTDVSKYYKLYASPRDRLKEALHPQGKKFHKKYYALNNISFELKPGKILGVVGKNGSGKSTLLKLISQVLVPNSGTVQVNGKVSALLELGAGFNPQFTGLENVFFYGTILGFSREYMQERLDAILAFADIGEFIRQPIKTYSSGMRARLAFAVATEIDPEILIVDEVLSVGDTIFQRKCYAKINSMFKNGKTVIFVSHNRNAIVGLCEKALLLDGGELLCVGEAEEVIQEYEKLCNKKFLENNKLGGTELPAVVSGQGAGKKPSDSAGKKIRWDSSLQGGNQVYLKKSDIVFEEFGIYDLDNNKSNVLETRKRYRIKAVFLANEECNDDITFALRIKNIQGYVVAWVGFPFEKDSFFSMKSGERKVIEFCFDNNLLHGVYSIDAGLQSFRDNDLFIHVGIQDLFLFRVDKDINIKKHGIVDLNCSEPCHSQAE